MNHPKTNLEIGQQIVADCINTNFHDSGQGNPVLLLHGSGPGVSAMANWRLTMPALATHFRVLAPDIVGFGYTERPQGFSYDMKHWLQHVKGFLDALEIETISIVGNSFGGALALAFSIQYPERVNKLVLMGSGGVEFPLTDGLDKVWGYTPSLENMKTLLDIFAYDRSRVTDELAHMRYQASIQTGFQESFAQMFPAPRQEGIKKISSDKEQIKTLPHETLIIHGREDRVIPLEASMTLFSLIKNAELHVFGKCGHWTQIEHANRFNRLLQMFLME